MPPGSRKALLVALVVALAAAGCSGGGKDDDAGKKDGTETSSEEFTHAAVRLGVSKAELVSPHQALGPLEQPTTDAVVAVVQKLLLLTSAQPLVEGKSGEGLDELLTADVATHATGPDRKAFFDEGLPRFGPLKTAAARIRLTGLAGTDDPSTALVIAKYLWDVSSIEHPTDRVVRDGELSLIKVGGAWKIGAYTMTVTRTIDDATTTTTATTK